MKKEELIHNTIQSVAKSIFSNIPIVGNLLDEVFFEFRGRVKQDRINRFIEELSLFFSEHAGKSMYEATIKSEDFVDILESVLRKVSSTQSDEKRMYYRDILIGQIEDPKPVEMTFIYLRILDRITDIQIKILKHLKTIEDGCSAPMRQILSIQNKIGERNRQLIWFPERLSEVEKTLIEKDTEAGWIQISKLGMEVEKHRYAYNGETYNCSQEELLLFFEDLKQMGLLNSINDRDGNSNILLFEMNSSGHSFLDFIS